MSHPVESEGTQILVLGLDGAGKTSLLHCFSSGSLEQDVEPTLGFNAVSVCRENMHIEFLEKWFYDCCRAVISNRGSSYP
ncbi:hypothetical protein ATANTOWER_023890 [Ataeniobius toweri]|uniref:Uncharacterized protein n=1 Tax=Ataeniobius toweri TaxID=208326 RepID=A0ABU7C3K9_9TELE|nr:hypothetical protein [Ataeniobius toweri]